MRDFPGRLVLLIDCLNLLAESPLMSHKFQVLGETAAAIIPCDWLALCITDKDSFRIHPLFDEAGIEDLDKAWDLTDSLTGKAMDTHNAVLTSLADHPLDCGPERRLLSAGLNRALVAPVSSGNQPIGAIYIASRRIDAFDSEDLRIAQLLSSGFGASLDSARMYQTINDQHDLLKNVVASVRDGILVVNFHDLLLLANPAAGLLLDHDAERLTGQPFTSCPATRKLAAALGNLPDGETVEFELPRGATAQATRAVITGEFGDPIGYAVLLRDISLLKDLERIRSELLRSLSHDLRGPLSTLGLAADFLNKGEELAPRQHIACEQIMNAITYMDTLVSELSDLGRLESKANVDKASGDLSATIAEVIDVLRVKADERSQVLQYSAPDRLMVVADFTQIRRLAFNLISNALKYTPESGAIDVTLSESADGVELEVRDNGIGIPKQDLPRLFDRNFRVNNAETRKHPGSGLGLAIAKHIVETHHGTITVESTPDKGSSFRAIMPRPQS